MLNRLHMFHLFMLPFLLTAGWVFMALWEYTFASIGYSLFDNIPKYEYLMDMFLNSFEVFPKDETAGSFMQDFILHIEKPLFSFIYILWGLFLTAGWIYKLPHQYKPMARTSLGWFVAFIYYPLVLSGFVTISAIVIRFFLDLHFDLSTAM